MIDKINHRKLINNLQEYMTLFGYHLIDTPIIENAELFLTKAGDQIAEKLFTFERHGRRLALRPEFTAAAAYLYIQNHTDDIIRWQFSGPIFEDDSQDTHRQYQHSSAGAELFGMVGPVADAELISMAVLGLQQAGVKDWRLVIGHVGLTRRLLEHFTLDQPTQRFILNRRDMLKGHNEAGVTQLLEQLTTYLPLNGETDPYTVEESRSSHTQTMLDTLLDTSPRGETMGGRTRQDITQRLMTKRRKAAQRIDIENAVYFLQEWANIGDKPDQAFEQVERYVGADVIAWPMFKEWQEIVHLLGVYGIASERILLQPDLARTWDYYTGMVFELQAPDGTPLAGGGRYDELARLIGGKKEAPAVGFAYYIDNIARSMQATPDAPLRYLLLYCSDQNTPAGIQWASVLRQQGFPIAMTNKIPENRDLALIVDDDGNLELQNHTYTNQQIDFLVMALERLNGDQTSDG